MDNFVAEIKRKKKKYLLELEKGWYIADPTQNKSRFFK